MSDPRTSSETNEAFVDRLRRARTGSRSTLGEILSEFRGYLQLLADRELDDRLRAKLGPSDVVQDTLVQAQQHIDDFAGTSEAELGAWLEQILWNCCRNARTAFVHTAKRNLTREVPLDGNPLAECVELDDKTPSGLAASNEEARLVNTALERLQPDERAVVRWHAWESLSFDAIADRLECSPDAARRLWLGAIDQMKDAWGLANGNRPEARR